MIPVLNVIGRKNSGKTMVVERITQELTLRGFKVATAKHISEKNFSVDIKGKDTFKHKEAGANPVVLVSDSEIAVLIKDGEDFSLEKMHSIVSDANVIVMEGFSRLLYSEVQVGKIVCVRTLEEYVDFNEKVKGEIISFCSLTLDNENVENINEGLDELVKKTIYYVKNEFKILKILRDLPGLNCGKCGYSSCYAFSKAVFIGKTTLNKCFIIKVKSKLKTQIKINNSLIHLQPFVSEIIKNSVLGMVKTLKEVKLKGDEYVNIEISE